MEVARLHDVVVDDADRANTRRCEIGNGRRPQSPGTHDKHGGSSEPGLPTETNFSEPNLPRIARGICY